MALITLRNVSKTYMMGSNRVDALRDVSLSIDAGEFVTITGPSGSGKSTMMHILGCLDRPTAGSYELDGQEVARMTPEELADTRNRRIGFVFQGFNLLPRTSALENVEVPLLYSRKHPNTAERHRRGLAVLEAMDLGGRADHHPSQLSGVEVMRTLQTLREERGITIVLITHEPEIAAYGTRIISIRDGVITEDRPNPQRQSAEPASVTAVAGA